MNKEKVIELIRKTEEALAEYTHGIQVLQKLGFVVEQVGVGKIRAYRMVEETYESGQRKESAMEPIELETAIDSCGDNDSDVGSTCCRNKSNTAIGNTESRLTRPTDNISEILRNCNGKKPNNYGKI